MYRFSRSIYRELSPCVVEDRVAEMTGRSNRQTVLEACEGTMRRLAADRRYFARPARSLFNDVRIYFPITEQVRVYKVIERNVELAIQHLEQLPGAGIGLDGEPIVCRASTRKGKPCQRRPLPGSEYCPSHKHLEETLEVLEPVESAELEPVGAAA